MGPLGFPATVEADERAEPLPAGLELLGELALAAEFVPVDRGGRYTGPGGALEALRAVARHEPGLAFGYGATRFAAALSALGSDDRRSLWAVLDPLLADGRVGYAGPIGVPCTGDGPGGVMARRVPAGWRLDGRCRTLAAGGTDLTIMHVMPGGLSSACWEVLAVTPDRRPAPPMVGLRTAAAEDLIFTAHPVQGHRSLGPTVSDAVRDLTGIVLPGAAVGILDTGLRATLRHVERRRLYGKTAADIPNVRATLAEAYADLLLCDVLVQAALRAAEPARHARTVRRLVPRLLIEAMNRLSTILGTFFYIRDGHVSVFQKLLRDLQTAFAAPPEETPDGRALLATAGPVSADPLLAEALPARLGRRRLDRDLRTALYADLHDHHAEDRTLDLTHRRRGTHDAERV
jgi:alkylation response protein AidB-like acyl-CoA dehydrogenase